MSNDPHDGWRRAGGDAVGVGLTIIGGCLVLALPIGLALTLILKKLFGE